MAKLTQGQRDKLSPKTFAGPDRSFPINDENHAKAALLLVNRAKGLSDSQRARIRSKARAKLGLKRKLEEN